MIKELNLGYQKKVEEFTFIQEILERYQLTSKQLRDTLETALAH